MRAGRVVTIRVMPKECMACVDVLRALGVIEQGMTFSRVVSLALMSLVKTAQDLKAIPVRDGFEFNEMMQPFEDTPSHRRRGLAISRALDERGPALAVPPLVSDYTRVRMQRRLDELVAKRQADPDNFSAAEQAEAEQLSDKLFT